MTQGNRREAEKPGSAACPYPPFSPDPLLSPQSPASRLSWPLELGGVEDCQLELAEVLHMPLELGPVIRITKPTTPTGYRGRGKGEGGGT